MWSLVFELPVGPGGFSYDVVRYPFLGASLTYPACGTNRDVLNHIGGCLNWMTAPVYVNTVPSARTQFSETGILVPPVPMVVHRIYGTPCSGLPVVREIAL